MTLYSTYTHVHSAFYIAPRLMIKSPHRNSGKTTLATILRHLSWRGHYTDNASKASIYSASEDEKVTLILDELDTYLLKDRELLGLLNSGHTRDGSVTRRIKGRRKQFSTYMPVVLVGIDLVVPTLESRSIIIPIDRKKEDGSEATIEWHNDEEPVAELEILHNRLAKWAEQNRDLLKITKPERISELHNRAWDNARVMLTIAQVAGGDWPEQARAGILALYKRRRQTVPASELLLGDIGKILAGALKGESLFIQTSELLAELHKIERWEDLTGKGLSEILRPFEIYSREKRVGKQVPRGYNRADFAEAVARYGYRP